LYLHSSTIIVQKAINTSIRTEPPPARQLDH